MTTPDPLQAPPFHSSLVHLLLITGVFFFNFIARIALAPFLIEIEQEFGLSHTEAGGLFLVISLGISLALVSSGFVSRALTHRRTIILSSVCVGLALSVVAWSRSLLLLQAGLFLLGVSAGIYFPSGIATVASILKPSDWGKGFSIHELAPNLSFLTAPLLALWLGPIMSWRSLLLCLGGASLAMGVVFALYGRGGGDRGEAPRLDVMQQIARRPEFWVLVLLFGLAIAANVAPFSMLAVYLIDARGYDPERANTLITLSRVAGPIVVLGAGWIIDRLGARRTAVVSMGVTGLFTVLLGLAQGPYVPVTVIAQPLLSVCYFPAGFTVLSQIFDSSQRNVAVSLVIPLALLFGTGLVPTLMGWFGDQQRFELGFVLLGALLLAGTFITGKALFNGSR